jgi:DNA-binding transcriptional regulator YhcF (GntR family)
MYYSFTNEVRTVLALAREEALNLQHEYVGTEHLLLGLLRDEKGSAAIVLKNLGAEAQQIAECVKSRVKPGRAAGTVGLGDLPYTSRGKKVLEQSMKAASALNDSYVGTEHLLLGLLREEKGIAADVLNEFGVTFARARDEAVRTLGKQVSRDRKPHESGGWFRRLLGSEEQSSAPDFAIRIDDSSSISIYEQIIARISEGVATGALRRGDRLPPVRRLADELDIAPGTVARAYSELERLGVVVTDGARGTRIADPPDPPRNDEELPEKLAGMLRPVAVTAYHLAASADELRGALERAMQGIYPADGPESGTS